MIVVLEGPRGVGKTTIARELAPALTELGFEVALAKFERGSDPTTDMLRTISSLKNDFRSSSTATIIDRFHLTEFVMRTVDNTVTRDVLAINMVNLSYALERAGAWVFVMTAPEAVRKDRVTKRDDGRPDEPPEVLATWQFLTTFLMGPSGRNIFANTLFINTYKATPGVVVAEMMGMIRARLRASYVHPE